RVLQGVTASAAPIFTMLGLSAHNQQVGHADDSEVVTVGSRTLRVNRAVSGDWPGAFNAYLDGRGVGMPMFLVGDNGSIEDPAQQPEGPDLQLLGHPSESFPALSVGSPWGIEEASCPDRPNPEVPTWHAHARHRFQIGLANDLIGYMIPAWGWATDPGVAPTTCTIDES